MGAVYALQWRKDLPAPPCREPNNPPIGQLAL